MLCEAGIPRLLPWGGSIAGDSPEKEAAGGDEGGSGALHGGADFGLPLAHQAGFGVGIVVVEGRGVERHFEDFGQMEGVAPGALGDLLAAAESVGDDEPVGGS